MDIAAQPAAGAAQPHIFVGFPPQGGGGWGGGRGPAGGVIGSPHGAPAGVGFVVVQGAPGGRPAGYAHRGAAGAGGNGRGGAKAEDIAAVAVGYGQQEFAGGGGFQGCRQEQRGEGGAGAADGAEHRILGLGGGEAQRAGQAGVLAGVGGVDGGLADLGGGCARPSEVFGDGRRHNSFNADLGGETIFPRADERVARGAPGVQHMVGDGVGAGGCGDYPVAGWMVGGRRVI